MGIREVYNECEIREREGGNLLGYYTQSDTENVGKDIKGRKTSYEVRPKKKTR